MNKKLLPLITASALLSGATPYDYSYGDIVRSRKYKPNKTYKNKNANIKYYIDEKGKIRKRKVGK